MSEKEANAVRRQDVLSFDEMRHLACPSERLRSLQGVGRTSLVLRLGDNP
jgi:hypothetical protein